MSWHSGGGNSSYGHNSSSSYGRGGQTPAWMFRKQYALSEEVAPLKKELYSCYAAGGRFSDSPARQLLLPQQLTPCGWFAATERPSYRP